jgi:hypothetical protein
VKNFLQQGEIANEMARVCIDSGDLDAAHKWYQIGHNTGLKEPDIKPARQDLWHFRWEHAQARIAARHGDQAEAQKHVAAAKAILDKGTIPEQAPFFPYLKGYVAQARSARPVALPVGARAGSHRRPARRPSGSAKACCCGKGHPRQGCPTHSFYI